jgi:hypothetical protein
MTKARTLVAVLVLSVFGAYLAQAQNPARRNPMTFFVTSVPIGDRGNSTGGLISRNQSQLHGDQVGHSDRIGNSNTSWNSSHAATGCSQADLASWGGAGLFYCFAVN